MKPYIKPTFEFIKLRTEERLACCNSCLYNGQGHRDNCNNNKNKIITGHGYDHGDGPGLGLAIGHMAIS